VGLKDLNDVTSLAYQYAKAVGAPCMTTSCCAQDELANWDRTIATLAAAGKVAATQGIRFTYHNHAPELQVVNGQTLLDRLYARTDAATVKAELDTAWVYAGGGDPVACIRRYPGRVPQIHAKDYSKASRKLVEIGRGDLDFEAIVAAGREAKTEWLIYELDASTIGDSLASARESLPRLKKLLG
jgi:sugar phosphate isomerase/epimerase